MFFSETVGPTNFSSEANVTLADTTANWHALPPGLPSVPASPGSHPPSVVPVPAPMDL